MPHKDPLVRRDYQKGYQRVWRMKNGERVSIIQKRCDQKRKGTSKRIGQTSEHRIRRHARQRLFVLGSYGGQCDFCGETRYEILTIDHINGGGTKHRKELYGKFRNIYDFLARNKFDPKSYRVLCSNCNHAKAFYGIEPGANGYKDWEWWEKFAKPRKGFLR